MGLFVFRSNLVIAITKFIMIRIEDEITPMGDADAEEETAPTAPGEDADIPTEGGDDAEM